MKLPILSHNQNSRKNIKWHTASVLLIGILVLLTYSDTFYSSWHFDDNSNIIKNKHLRIDSFSPSAPHYLNHHST
ncbi:MAG: hypothetical protein L0956_05845, partial [Candidatus Mariimomonas ferrooxydans]